MIHKRIFRHLALGLFSFCFSAAAFAACEYADVSRCIGSSNKVDVTFTATLQNPSCNVSLGGESNQGSQSMTVDFGQIIATDLWQATSESRYVRPLGIFLTGCENLAFNKAVVTFSAPADDILRENLWDSTLHLGISIKARSSNSYIPFNQQHYMTLESSGEGYVEMYDIYFNALGSDANYAGYFNKSFQVIVGYN